ncbi:MAG: DEAD/DEAH box helicase [Cyanobacteria bacterium]|nr:DEAD/DEAH box helicase [Cyanobacteriota bacterium]
MTPQTFSLTQRQAEHLTSYHAKYYAFELTKRCSSNTIEKLVSSLHDAQVELNPHQIDAALFAFQSPLSKGAILADEVGLGKTIEAGIVIAQKWAEHKRNILIIVPSNLRNQWRQELLDKFFIPTVILETKSFNQEIKNGNLNPFLQKGVIICSYQFVKSKEPYVQQTPWDLVVIDEAHRLRNVYKPSNIIGNSIKRATDHAPKILLTATPLQNTLLELYGLVSFIDQYTFGDIKSFKSQFSRLTDDENYDDLKERLKPVCKRTLRRQVLEYISYTNRIAITQKFEPRSDEQKLYNLVSNYLQSDNLYALPSGQRTLMTLILRKLLASSTYAISGTLEALAKKLTNIVDKHQSQNQDHFERQIAEDFETYDELKDEWDEEEEFKEERVYTDSDINEIKDEIDQLQQFKQLAESIQNNSKGEVLLTALEKGFAQAEKGGASKKAIIFTESTRTQLYLKNILENTQYKSKIVLFNGSNNDLESKAIYKRWLEKYKNTDKITGSKTSDLRAAIVEHFKNDASIMIATEAAAEGINLQFCSLVINYDLPWNPQRIEQRIGRCHRYGQKYDVVVVNFLNVKNAADVRVHELLEQKFKLFSGVFGASDDVLGVIESGVDFEKRIATIVQTCRTEEQIQIAFTELRKDLDETINENMISARQKLLENFDEEVNEKLRITIDESFKYLNKYEEWLWLMTQFYLKNNAKFNQEEGSFFLVNNPFPGEQIHEGPYRIGKNIEDANIYRMGHPLAQKILEQCKASELADRHLTFDYSNTPQKIISILKELVGQSGWMRVSNITVDALEVEDYVILNGITDDYQSLTIEQCQRLFSLPANEKSLTHSSQILPFREAIQENFGKAYNGIINDVNTRNGHYFEIELEKLDKWGEDQRTSLKMNLKELDSQIKELKKQARLAGGLPEKLKLEKEKRQLDHKRDETWREYDLAAKEIEKKKDGLIDEIEARLKQNTQIKEIFFIRWSLI